MLHKELLKCVEGGFKMMWVGDYCLLHETLTEKPQSLLLTLTETGFNLITCSFRITLEDKEKLLEKCRFFLSNLIFRVNQTSLLHELKSTHIARQVV